MINDRNNDKSLKIISFNFLFLFILYILITFYFFSFFREICCF